MARITLKPDTEFTRQLMKTGGDSLKECFQCATCSVACPLAPENKPFPRKEMVWASFGLKDKLMGDIDLWLCRNCGNCSDLCPRGAQPAAMMSAARDLIYQDLIFGGRVSRWLSNIRGLLWLTLIPAIIWLIVWAIRADIAGGWFPRAADGRIVFGTIFYGDYTIDPIFMLTFFGALWILYLGCRKLLARFRPEGTLTIVGPVKKWYCALAEVLWEEVISAKKFAECECGPATGVPTASRRVSHTLMVWSFCILAFVTAVVAFAHWGGRLIPAIHFETPMPMGFWVKILANVGALLLIVALGMLTWRRATLDPRYQKSNYYDWYLLGIIWAVAITGILTQTFRLMDCIHAAFIIYYIHLVVVWMLFAYAPWSKLGHFVYRTAALTYAKMYGRD